MKEQWKIYKTSGGYKAPVKIYEVSNLGRVRVNGEIVEPYIHSRYLQIGSFQIHRAVAELFVPNPENKPFVDHINTDRFDNRAENLRWVTTKENCNNPLTRKHCSEAKLGKVLTAEHKKKISEANKGKHRSEEHKRKISEARTGRTLSEETKRKISAAHKGKTISEEHKRKLIAANTGRIKSEEELRKISIASKGKIPWNKGLKLGKRKKRGN